MAYAYPTNDFDNGKKLLALLGSYWSQVYGDTDTIESVMYARAQREAQAHLDLLELVYCTSRYTVPLFHRDHWYLLTLKESDLNAEVAILRFGENAVLGFQPETGLQYQFGIPVAGDNSAFPLPDKLADCRHIFNRITEPSRSLTAGIDFILDARRQAVLFRENPFDDPLIPVRDVVDDLGEVVDRECGLWVFMGGFDYKYVYRHFGYLLGLQLQSTDNYRQLINALLDAAVGGTSLAQITGAVCALTGVPLVHEPVETVELVTRDATGLLIATDRHIYRFATTATATVTPGQVVHAGDSLTDAVELFEFNRGQVPEDLLALSIGRNFVGEAYYADLTFRNAETPLVVEEDVDGFTKISFDVSGWPLDVEAFWSSLHERGVARGETLAHLLDVRDTPPDEPTAASLPATVNPLQFLIQNVLRNNASLVKIKAVGLDGTGLGLEHARWLRKIVPPHTFLFILVELEASGDTVTMVGPGDSSQAGYEESPDTLLEMPPDGETLDGTTVVEAPTLELVSDYCQ